MGQETGWVAHESIGRDGEENSSPSCWESNHNLVSQATALPLLITDYLLSTKYLRELEIHILCITSYEVTFHGHK
jgi:hypothetical protein